MFHLRHCRLTMQKSATAWNANRFITLAVEPSHISKITYSCAHGMLQSGAVAKFTTLRKYIIDPNERIALVRASVT